MQAILVYVLIIPRMKDYSYVLAIVPCLCTLEEMTPRLRVGLLAYGMFPYDRLFRHIHGLENPFHPSPWRLPFDHSALFVAAICWFSAVARAPGETGVETLRFIARAEAEAGSRARAT